MAALLLGWSGTSSALGLGAGDAAAVMGQPLNFSVAVRLDAGELLAPECVGAEVTVGERRVPAPFVRTALELTGAGSARARVSTQAAIDEPVVQVQLSVGCLHRVTRQYVLLADPPGLAIGPGPAPQPAAVLPPAEPVASAAAPPAPPTQPARAASGSAAPAAASAATPTAPVARPVTSPAPVLTPEQIQAREERRARARAERQARQRAAREARQARAAAEAREGQTAAAPRLQVDVLEAAPRGAGGGIEPDAVARAMAAVAEAASAAQAAASAASASALRIAALEGELASLRAEAQSSREQAAALRAQLAEAQSSGHWTTPLLLALVLLALIAGWLAMRVGRLQAAQRDRWQDGLGSTVAPAATGLGHLDGGDGQDSPSATAPVPFVNREGHTTILTNPVAEAVPPTVSLPKAAAARARANPAWPPPAPPVAWPAAPSTLPPEPAEASLGGLVPEPDLAPDLPTQRTEAYPAGGRSAETSPRDVSIEELIDLEQQAEFFMVLGQDDAAVDLLVEHLRSTGGGSPLPYLKLLEIFHRQGNRDAYERMRQRFNHRFNAYAPEWGIDMTSGRSLEDYAGVVPRLQQVWPRPLDAMAELEALLFRKSRGELFDLPAYREVLFLYALARDLLDRSAVDTQTVDLLLPLNDGTDTGSTLPAPLAGLDRDAFKDTLPPEDTRATAPLDFDLTSTDRPTSLFSLLDEPPARPPRQP